MKGNQGWVLPRSGTGEECVWTALTPRIIVIIKVTSELNRALGRPIRKVQLL